MINKEILAQIILDFQKDNLPELIDRELKVDLEIPLKRAIAPYSIFACYVLEKTKNFQHPLFSNNQKILTCSIEQLTNWLNEKMTCLRLNF